MEREPYSRYFTEDTTPAWKCPSCHSGLLKLSKQNLLRRQTAASAAEQRQDFSEFEWIKTKVAAMFVCSHCDESVACTANGWVDEIYGDDANGDVQRDWEDRFTPQYFAPPLVLMDIPEDCPAGVASHLETSFSMYFCNPGASANAARIALEVLMDEWGVPKDDNGKTLSLHQRLQRLPPAYSGLKELLLAVKWLGNDGSHGGDLIKDDVNTLYDFLEVALHEAYDKKKDSVFAKARAINQARLKSPKSA